ncbi:MAG TPA: methyltransferase domain-containing protein [Candidatus Binataceae bacterium]|nr:methyltransferase domain-containing protein [Candidatus Binataceae bacterium]
MAEPHESRIYYDLARFYDAVFGRAFVSHEHEVIDSLNLRPGQRVLEVGVGTGVSLDSFPPYVHLVGIDPSADMLARAVKRIEENRWKNIEVRQGDALALDFPDNSFDDVLTFHVISVVPDPQKMMAEMVRVCKPGGRIVIVNHFTSPNPIIYFLNSLINPITRHLGWTTRLRARDVMEGHNITIERFEPVARFSIHDLIIARKNA